MDAAFAGAVPITQTEQQRKHESPSPFPSRIFPQDASPELRGSTEMSFHIEFHRFSRFQHQRVNTRAQTCLSLCLVASERSSAATVQEPRFELRCR
ncbi:hypothetical protein JOB18_008255 [Solea senegalensis]|uniref:Uncharacterized protein n=1 Tax=Solea senegalensis TaxID=28829 RepID=A0AAV6R9Y0_SOLSE|nr:hypothetical protein JOB18_008255 [Solea senegalensis]